MSAQVFDADALARVLFDGLGLPADASFALAFSGGHDSTVLLHALCAATVKVTALHFDHRVAADSADWVRHCESVCAGVQVKFVSARADESPPASGVEAWAREQRYRWFADATADGQVLLTAHHADDQAETVLLNLMRGGGVHSLAGIPRSRWLSSAKSTRVARPLLSFTRAALTGYARRHELAWLDDPSNRDAAHDRNFIRQSVLPLLERRRPGAARCIAAAAERCRDAADYLDDAMTPLLAAAVAPSRRGVFCIAPPLDARALKTLSRFAAATLVRRWLHRHGQRSPSAKQLDALLAQLAAEKKRARINLHQSQLRCFDGHLFLTRVVDAAAADTVAFNLKTCDLNGVRLTVTDGDGDLDPNRLRGKTLKLVRRVGGERITLPGRTHSSALKKLFQANKVPPWERDSLPLLTADGKVVWAHGVGVAAAAAVTTTATGTTTAGVTLRFVADA